MSIDLIGKVFQIGGQMNQLEFLAKERLRLFKEEGEIAKKRRAIEKKIVLEHLRNLERKLD